MEPEFAKESGANFLTIEIFELVKYEVENKEIIDLYNKEIVNSELYNKVIKRYNDFAFKRQGVLEFLR